MKLTDLDKQWISEFAKAALASPAVVMGGDCTPQVVAKTAFEIARFMHLEYLNLSAVNLVGGLSEAEWAQLDAKKPIDAIKLYRDRTGVGLKEAKEAVEKAMAAKGLDISGNPIQKPKNADTPYTLYKNDSFNSQPQWILELTGGTPETPHAVHTLLLTPQEIDLIQSGKKIDAIKEVRNRVFHETKVWLTLKEAKDIVEDWASYLYAQNDI